MNLADFDYYLPPERIAQQPAEPRDASRLMVMHRQSGRIEHRQFRDVIEYLNPGDVLVLNQTRVIPARLHAYKTETGGMVEILLLKQLDALRWKAMVGGKRVLEGVELALNEGKITVTVEEVGEESQRVIRFDQPIERWLEDIGEMPLPPYIKETLQDPERYQTVYSRVRGSAAAPTAGLHFTGDLLMDLQQHGVQLAYCTLHVGLDTFAPVKEENIYEHKIHRERAILTPEDARIINEAKLAGGRIVAVGTTSVRTLESAAIRSAAFGTEENTPESVQQTLNHLPENLCPWRPVVAVDEETDLYITPGYRFRAVDVMITNFHLPRSTLLMLVSAFAGREQVLQAYQIAIEHHYRFYSLGDAMLFI